MWLMLVLACAGDKIDAYDSEGSDLPVLVVSSVSPNRVGVEGGANVVVRGTGFTEPSEVTIGGAACLMQAFVSEREIGCTVPPGTPGEVLLQLMRLED